MPSSPLPCTKCAGISRVRMRSSVSRIIGPGTMSPPKTMPSTRASRTSASTAQRAGKFAWMSQRAATRIRHLLHWRDFAFPEIPGARVLAGVAHAQLGLVGLDVSDLSAERDRPRLRLGIDVQVHAAPHHSWNRRPDDDRAMATHQSCRLLTEALRQRLPELPVSHQQVGKSRRLADVEDRYAFGYECSYVVHRAKRYVGIGKRDQ